MITTPPFQQAPHAGAPAPTAPPSSAAQPKEAGGRGIPSIAREIARSAPGTLTGADRVRYYAECIRRLDHQRREGLRMYVDRFVQRMHELGASDIDMGGAATAGRVWYRVDGCKKPYDEIGAASLDEVDILLLNLLGENGREDIVNKFSADFSYVLHLRGQQRRFRATMYFDLDHLGLCMRAISEEIRPFKSLSFHPAVERGLLFSKVRDGLTLVTGVTGSGKSTTLDSIIDANNEDFDGHIVIIAKPIEYMHHPKRCIVRHREVGRDVTSFKEGVAQALRQDPDIIMIGEMRDPETIDAAVEAADTGHKVFSTIHTSSAIESLDRIVAEYPSDEQNRIRIRLADVLRCVVSQKLCPRIGGGRVLTKEVLWMTSAAKAAIYNGNTNEIYQMIWEGGAQGMITLEQDLHRLVLERKITPETALDYANNKRRLQQLLR